ncbi:MAG: twin-arginine translocation pathway signal protein [Burkholderiales bacterium]
MKRRDFVRLAGGGVVFAALPNLPGCSSEIPTEAVAAWRGPATDVNVREWILSYAILAPHSHNLQSWMVDLRQPDSIILYCDLGRLLPETDPYSRQIMMSHGTFLELLDMAAREKRLRAEIELFPEGAFDMTKIDQRPVARVRLAADTNVKRDPLFAEITRRRTNREAYETRVVPPEAIRGITDSVAGYPIRIGFVGNDKPDLLTKHRTIAAEAWRIELVTPRTILESYKVLRVGPEEIAKHRDGISVNRPFLRLLASLGLFDRSKAPSPEDYATTSQIKEFNSKLDTTPAFFWMITEGNDRKTQVNAGRAYVRAQLAATQQGLSMQPISQALQEYPEVAGPYAAIHQLLDAPPPGYTVQMWTRLGYAPAIGPAPRRGLKEHIVRS